jgi:hypothetical protein
VLVQGGGFREAPRRRVLVREVAPGGGSGLVGGVIVGHKRPAILTGWHRLAPAGTG